MSAPSLTMSGATLLPINLYTVFDFFHMCFCVSLHFAVIVRGVSMLILSRLPLDDSSSESGSANGVPSLTPPTVAGAAPPEAEVNGGGVAAPLDFSTTSSSPSSEEQQPINLAADNTVPDGLRRKYPGGPPHAAELRLDYGNKVGTKGTGLVAEGGN